MMVGWDLGPFLGIINQMLNKAHVQRHTFNTSARELTITVLGMYINMIPDRLTLLDLLPRSQSPVRQLVFAG